MRCSTHEDLVGLPRSVSGALGRVVTASRPGTWLFRRDRWTMTTRLSRPFLLAAVLASVVTVTSVAGATSRTPPPSRTRFPGIPAANGIYAACYNLRTHALRIVRATDGCDKKSERRASWNKIGPKGSKGPTGPAGGKGPSGPAGPAGAPRPHGSVGHRRTRQARPGRLGPQAQLVRQALQAPRARPGRQGPQAPRARPGRRGPLVRRVLPGPTGPTGPAGAAGPTGSRRRQRPARSSRPHRPHGCDRARRARRCHRCAGRDGSSRSNRSGRRDRPGRPCRSRRADGLPACEQLHDIRRERTGEHPYDRLRELPSREGTARRRGAGDDDRRAEEPRGSRRLIPERRHNMDSNRQSPPQHSAPATR